MDRSWLITLLALYAALAIGTAWHESATYDEPLHILAGTVAWKTGQTDLDYSNPPLADYWQTLPLLLKTYHSFPTAKDLNQFVYGYSFGFVHYNRYSSTSMLFPPRLMNVLLSVILGLILFMWTREALGSLTARLALFAFAFCPVLIAFGSLVKADMAGALGWMISLFMCWKWQKVPSYRQAFLVGLSFGAALCMKYSAVLILPAALGAIILDRTQTSSKEQRTIREWAEAVALVILGTTVIMMLCFRGWGLPDWLHAFWKAKDQFKDGFQNYYWGQFGRKGWLSFFFMSFALKTPLPFLIVLLTFALGWRENTAESRRFLLVWCLWPAGLLFLVSAFSTIQVGIRHILPVYPFFCMAVGEAAARLWQSRSRSSKQWVIFLGAWYVLGCACVFPRYLSYFNELVTPSSNGYRYFVDSNLDWGQGLQALADDLHRRGSPPIYLSYFGCADPGNLGIRFQPILMTTCAQVSGMTSVPLTNSPLYFAISATNRVGVYYEPHNVFDWLNSRQPVKIVMDSIWLYDFTNDPEAKARLKALTSRPQPIQ